MLSAIGGGLVAALVVTAAVVLPRVMQSQRVEECTALVAELQQAFDARAVAATTLEAALALTVAQHEEARGLAERVAALGDAPEPILSAERAESLARAGAAAADAVGEAPDVDERGVPLFDALADAWQRLREEDAQARADAEAADEEPPAPVAPASYLMTDIATAVSIMDAPVVPEQVEPVGDEDVTQEVVEETGATIAVVTTETAQLEEHIEAEKARTDGFAEAIAGTLPALRAAAEAPVQAQRVIAQTDKAPKSSEKVTAAGARLERLAESEDAAELQAQIASYVAAAETAQAKHQEVVEREERERQERERQEREARQRANSGGGGGGGGGTNQSRVCSRYQAGWFGSPGQLVLVPC